MQVGVIVAGVLAAGVCQKVWSNDNITMPVPVTMLCRYGVFGFLIPLAWSAGALALYRRPGVSDDIKSVMFWFGVLILIALVVFVIYADVTPWLRVMWRLSGEDE